jgi:hypothetical protein
MLNEMDLALLTAYKYELQSASLFLYDVESCWYASLARCNKHCALLLHVGADSHELLDV